MKSSSKIIGVLIFFVLITTATFQKQIIAANNQLGAEIKKNLSERNSSDPEIVIPFGADSPTNNSSANSIEWTHDYPHGFTYLSSFDNIGGEAEDILLRDELAYLQCSDGIQILNVSNPLTPTRLGRVDFADEGSDYGFALSDDYLFSSNSLYDISNPLSPRFVAPLAQTSLLTSPKKIVLSQHYAYVIAASRLVIVDIHNPLYSINTSSFEVSGSSLRSVEVSGDIAYLLTSQSELYLVNVSNPYLPTEISHFLLDDPSQGLTISNNYAFISDQRGLKILNVSNPLAVAEIGSFNSSQPVYETTITGSLAFLCEKSGGLEIANITIPSSPTFVGNFSIGGEVENIAISENVAFVADSVNGLEILNISEPTSPTLFSNFSNNVRGDQRKICLKDDLVYIGDQERGLIIMNISDPFQLVEVGVYYPQKPIRDLYLNESNDLLYVVIGNEGLRILDVGSDPTLPVEIGNYTTSVTGAAVDIAVSGEVALLALGYSGLMILNVSDPTAPSEITRTLGGEAWRVRETAFYGNYAFVCLEFGGVLYYDLSNPNNTEALGILQSDLTIRAIYISNNNLIFLSTLYFGIMVYSISETGGQLIFSFVDGLDIIGNEFMELEGKLFITQHDQIFLYVISDPQNITLLATWSDGKLLYGLIHINGLIYVTHGESGLVILSLDSDKDGLSDYEEGLLGTNVSNQDSESDGMGDGWETEQGLDPLVDDATADLDGDGLSNLEEYQSVYNIYSSNSLKAILRPDPDKVDSDTDGLSDFEEVENYRSNPCSPDSDLDMITDYKEILFSTSINNPDSDGDGLADGNELYFLGTDPTKSDTDDDGMPDNYELKYDLNPLANDSDEDADGDGLPNLVEYQNGTKANNPDSDGDDLTDYEEIFLYSTDPNNSDSDGDSLSDYEEINTYTTDPNSDDSDDDGLTDDVEIYYYFTDPNNADSDGDKFTDKEEIDRGFDPNDPKSSPRAKTLRIIAISFGGLGVLIIAVIGGGLLMHVWRKISTKRHEV